MSTTERSRTSGRQYVSKRNPALPAVFALVLGTAIALIGLAMMTIGSSPTVKGASFIWLPAALQLVAGVWLGPFLGFLAGGLGAYAAGILAYGGWGIVDIIMNPIAGGFANAVLPWILFKALRIDPGIGVVDKQDLRRNIPKAILLTVVVLLAGLANIWLGLPSPWGLVLPLVVLVIGATLLLRGIKAGSRDLLLALLVAVICCVVSALIGAIGATVGGKPFSAALLDPGIGWFVGDTISAFLGVYLLMVFTPRVREAIGIYGESNE